MTQPPFETSAPGKDLNRALVGQYHASDNLSAWLQVTNSLGPYALIWAAIFYCSEVSAWLVIPLAVLNAFFLVRIFVLFHDCGHGSLFSQHRLNQVIGAFCGMLAFTPYDQWRREHSLHHAHFGNLDRRGAGDVWTMTVEEYRAASPAKRFLYRALRHPVVLFLIIPVFFFTIAQRVPWPNASAADRRSVWRTNFALLVSFTIMISIFGWFPFLLAQAITIGLAGSLGTWLFYVQHQFEDVYWQRGTSWEFNEAALKGSSYYQLPKILEWFSASIGFHHVHHYSPRIPNYRLRECHQSFSMFQNSPKLTLRSSLRATTLHLWDESTGKLIPLPTYLHQSQRQPRQVTESQVAASDNG